MYYQYFQVGVSSLPNTADEGYMYEISVITGSLKGSATKSGVYFKILGNILMARLKL